MSSTINPLSPMSLSSPNASSSTSPTSTDPTTSLGSENTFLQLLVAQIKNQDPTQPVDSSTFLTQLAEFSSLEQLIGINQGVAALDPHRAGLRIDHADDHAANVIRDHELTRRRAGKEFRG